MKWVCWTNAGYVFGAPPRADLHTVLSGKTVAMRTIGSCRDVHRPCSRLCELAE